MAIEACSLAPVRRCLLANNKYWPGPEADQLGMFPVMGLKRSCWEARADMDYTLDKLSRELAGQEPGHGVAIDLSIYRRLFPPGEPDNDARQEASAFAIANNCTVHFGTYTGAIFFRRKKPNEVSL